MIDLGAVREMAIANDETGGQTMPLSAQDREYVRLIASKVAKEVVKETLTTTLKIFVGGLCIGSALFGGSIGAALVQVLK